VLNWLGLRDEVAALGGDMATMVYRDGITGEVLCDFSLAPVTAQTGQKPYPVARADLQAPHGTFGEDDIHLGKQVVASPTTGHPSPSRSPTARPTRPTWSSAPTARARRATTSSPKARPKSCASTRGTPTSTASCR
jgi:hypothetical protein